MSAPDPDDEDAPMARKDWLLWVIVAVGFAALVGAPLTVLWVAPVVSQVEAGK